MERLFTSITNAGSTTTQNENMMQTGYYAGEREDFMRENLFMTETIMAPVKIALDHGWSSIKGEHIFMETSVVPMDYEPLTKNGLLEYKGKKYIVGQGRLGKQATKTENENYFLLTLVGIAKELQYQGKTAASYVELYAGVPLTLFGAERKEFRDYLWHKERISFTFEGVHYSFFMDKVKIYAQCYAAIANRMGDMDRLRCVDLGSWTLDVLSVRNRIPMDKDAYTYELVTFDAYLWQTLENKQKFISQIMTSKSPVRACDDIDETALSYAEIKALCAGDERIKEKMDLDVDVARLKLMKANHQSQQYRLEDNLLRYFPEQIEQSKGFIAGFEADMKTLAEHPHPALGFAGMTVRGDVLTDKENAGAALVDAFKDVKGLDPVQIGSYRGFQMSLTLEDFGRDYVLTLKGQMTHRVTLGKDPRGNLTRIDNALNGMAERLATTQSRLESLYSQMETAKQELGKPFPQEDELRVKSARLAELNIALNIDDKTPLEALAEEAPVRTEVAKSARPSVLQKLHSYEKPSKATPTEPKKSKEEVL